MILENESVISEVGDTLLILRLSFGSRFPLGTSTDTDSAFRIRRAGAAATRNSYQEKGHT